MNIKVYDTVTGSTFTFPMLPKKVEFSCGTKFLEYELMKTGDVSIPQGEELSEITWDGILPGKNRQNAPYVGIWKNPREAQELWSTWRVNGRKLRLTIDGTPINHGVYLKGYNVEYSGGFGDYSYSITFIVAREIDIKIEARTDDSAADTGAEESSTGSAGKQYVTVTKSRVNVRKSASMSGQIVFVATKGEKYEYAGKTSGNWYNIVTDRGNLWIHTTCASLSAETSATTNTTTSTTQKKSSGSRTHPVKKGESLWALAQKYYRDGSKYTKIKSANNLTSDTIYVGQKLKIP